MAAAYHWEARRRQMLVEKRLRLMQELSLKEWRIQTFQRKCLPASCPRILHHHRESRKMPVHATQTM